MPMDLATVDHLLTTTSAMRKRLNLDRPIEPAVLERCIEIALQAPSGSNRQGWHFAVVPIRAERRVMLLKDIPFQPEPPQDTPRGAPHQPRACPSARPPLALCTIQGCTNARKATLQPRGSSPPQAFHTVQAHMSHPSTIFGSSVTWSVSV